MEKLSVAPMPSGNMQHPENITVHLFDTHVDSKLERLFLAIHFPSVKMLVVYTLVQIPTADTLCLHPAVNGACYMSYDYLCSWISKWQAWGASDTDDNAWKTFVDALCKMVNIPLSYHVKGTGWVTPDSWEPLAHSASHDRLKHDEVFKSLDVPFHSQSTIVRLPVKKPHKDIVPTAHPSKTPRRPGPSCVSRVGVSLGETIPGHT